MLVKDGEFCWEWIELHCPKCNHFRETLTEAGASRFVQGHVSTCDVKWYEIEFRHWLSDPMTETQKIEYAVPYLAQVQHYPKRWPEDFT